MNQSREVQVNIYFDKDRMLRLEAEGEKIAVHGMSMLEGQELSFAFIIKEALNCLLRGKDINLHFSPADTEEDEHILYKCQWLKGGGIRVIDDHATERWRHANNLSEALERKRIFTCSRALFKKLPLRRHG